MRTRLIIGFLLFVSLFTVTAHASREGLLQLSLFSIESTGIGNSGPVEVSGSQDDKGITTIRIKAFHKEFTPTKTQMSSLRNFTSNGIQLSYEAGYKAVGGRTIYLLFSKGFTLGQIQSRLVTVNEAGGISITDGRDNKAVGW